MRHLKHILAAALTMLLALAVATPAFAASITIKDGDPTGHVTTSYDYYQILRASINGDKVSYYLLDKTDDALRTQLAGVKVGGKTLFTIKQTADGTRWNVTVNSGFSDSDGEAIAKALNTTAIKNAAITTGNFKQTDTGRVTASGLDKGYYLITSSLGSNLVLQTLNDVTIDTKNSYIENKKSASKTNMEVGDIVTYTITVSVPASAVVGNEITVHDTLDSHLEAKMDTISAKLGSTPIALSDGTKKAATETFAKKFTITQDMLGKDVRVTYDAELLSTAADDTGYVNEVFSETNGYETLPVEVEVWTFDFDLDKEFEGFVKGTDDPKDFVATFQLRTDATKANTAIRFVDEGNYKYVKADSKSTNASVTLTVDQENIINVRGLAAGTYYLVEMTTTEGYNLLTVPIEVTITDTTKAGDAAPSHSVSYKIGEEAAKTGTVTVLNQSGTVLPSTGGIGTTLFYVIGGAMVLTAGVVLVTKRRMAQIEE